MKTQKMTNDQFALFMAEIIKSVEMHNFDAFYDIAKIVKRKSENHGTEIPKRENFYLVTRPTGIDLVSTLDENLDHYLKNNKKHYLITFCWNCDYFRNEEFAVVEELN